MCHLHLTSFRHTLDYNQCKAPTLFSSNYYTVEQWHNPSRPSVCATHGALTMHKISETDCKANSKQKCVTCMTMLPLLALKYLACSLLMHDHFDWAMGITVASLTAASGRIQWVNPLSAVDKSCSVTFFSFLQKSANDKFVSFMCLGALFNHWQSAVLIQSILTFWQVLSLAPC